MQRPLELKKKLALSTETIRVLDDEELAAVNGGVPGGSPAPLSHTYSGCGTPQTYGPVPVA
jgi:bacteriocin-like protein